MRRRSVVDDGHPATSSMIKHPNASQTGLSRTPCQIHDSRSVDNATRTMSAHGERGDRENPVAPSNSRRRARSVANNTAVGTWVTFTAAANSAWSRWWGIGAEVETYFVWGHFGICWHRWSEYWFVRASLHHAHWHVHVIGGTLLHRVVVEDRIERRATSICSTLCSLRLDRYPLNERHDLRQEGCGRRQRRHQRLRQPRCVYV